MLDPPVAPTAANPSRRAAGPFTPRNAHLVTQHEPWYRYVPESGNWHGGTSTRWIAALSAASHIRQHPDELHQGLKIITETTRRFVTQVVQRGADGLFFASQAVDPNYITPEEHAEFAKRYDLQVLEATGGKTWFDIFHLHGREISFDQVLDYPVHAFNYHDRDHGPSLSEMRKRTTKCLLGGISPGGPIAKGTPDEVAWEVEDAWNQLGGRGLIITPGEVANPRSKPVNVDRLRTAIAATRQG